MAASLPKKGVEILVAGSPTSCCLQLHWVRSEVDIL